MKLLLDRGADISRKDKVNIVNIYFLYVPFKVIYRSDNNFKIVVVCGGNLIFSLS